MGSAIVCIMDKLLLLVVVLFIRLKKIFQLKKQKNLFQLKTIHTYYYLLSLHACTQKDINNNNNNNNNNATGSGKYNSFSAEIHCKLEDITDILWRDTWFS